MWSKMYDGLTVKFLLFLSYFNKTWIFSADFRKNTQIYNFTKIRPLGAKLFHVERQTWRSFIVAFRNFAKAPKNWRLPQKILTATGMHFVTRAMRTSLPIFPRVSIGLSTWKPYWIPPCLGSGFHNLVNVECRVWGTPAAPLFRQVLNFL